MDTREMMFGDAGRIDLARVTDHIEYYIAVKERKKRDRISVKMLKRFATAVNFGTSSDAADKRAS